MNLSPLKSSKLALDARVPLIHVTKLHEMLLLMLQE